MGESSDVVRRMYQAFIRGDWDAFFDCMDPHVTADLSRSFPDGGVVHGHDGVWRGWRAWRGAWDRYELEVEGMEERGEKVLALTHVEARSRGQGLETQFRGADLFRVRNGRIVEFANYTDRDAARRDFGP